MKLGALFSGGKDSTYATYLAKQAGHEISCLITIVSENKDSFMFHTPAINLTEQQAESMALPMIQLTTKGEKEKELEDLEKAIKLAIKKYKIRGIVTGAVGSVYQASRIQKICNKLSIECFNPLWQKDQVEILNELLKSKFQVIIAGVAAFPFTKEWVRRKIDEKTIEELKMLQEKYQINPAGEGGEFESLVVSCPLFSKNINLGKPEVIGEGNSWRMK